MSNVQPLTAGETLTSGDESDRVAELQRWLHHLGHYQGDIDGRYADSTEAAVRAYQSASGQTESGTVDADTWTALDTAAQNAGYAGEEHGGEGAADTSGGLEAGTLSEDGAWLWDGVSWVPAQPSGEDDSVGEPAALEVGTLSEDGAWQWNGTEWVAAGGAGTSGEQAGEQQYDIQPGQLSEDGAWQWNGTEWVAAAGAAASAETSAGASAEAGTEASAESGAAPSGEAGAAEAKPWTNEINSEIDDPGTEAADLPSLEEAGAPGSST